MLSPNMASVWVGIILIFVAVATKKEKWQMAYGISGIIFIFWGLGYFAFGRFTASLMPPLTLLFAVASFYTKGAAQLLSIICTFVLVMQITI